MPASYINLTAGSSILRDTVYERTIEGLEKITEHRTCLTADVSSLLSTYKNNAVHPTYGNMVVEETNSSPMPGGLSSLSVRYVGLFSSALPSPLINVEPVDAFLHNPVQVVIRFVASADDDVSLAAQFGKYRPMPASPFRGVPFYQSIRAPYETQDEQGRTIFTYYGMLSTGCFFQRHGKYVIVTATYKDYWGRITNTEVRPSELPRVQSGLGLPSSASFN